MPNFYKPIESYIATKKETSTSKSLSSSEVVYTLTNRTTLTDKYANYFQSFNLPYESDAMLSGSSTALNFPEIFQLNVNQILVIPISKNNYSEYINGRSITIEVPQWGNTYKTVVSTLYTETDINAKKQSHAVLGSNLAFLFSDDINLPYTGTTDFGTIDREDIYSWDPVPTDYRKRPNAVAYSDLEGVPIGGGETSTMDIGTDTRPWGSVDLALYVPASYPSTLNVGYNYDIPVGFAALDKGYLIITHPTIIGNIPWTSGSTCHYNEDGDVVIDGSNGGASSATTNIAFTAITYSTSPATPLKYEDISVAFKTSIVCVAMPKEFYLTTNPTWDLAKNLSEVQNQTYNLDSIYVTQIGLYNKNFEMIAVAKIDRPTEKTYTNVIVFNLDIDI